MGILDTLGLSSSSANTLAKKSAQAEKAGYGKASKISKRYYNTATGAIDTGVTQATGALAPAITAAGNYVNAQNQGYGTYMDALGLNGPEGTARATAAYNASLQPGLNQSLETIRRQDAGGGRFGSGSLATDFGDYIFNSQYDPWRTSLAGFNPLGAITEQGNLGQAQAGIYTGGAGALAGLATGQGTQQGGYALGSANALANMYNQQAANNAAVAGNWGNLAGQLLGAGTKLFGMYGPTPNPGSMGGNTIAFR